jgi:hypothetical protein
MFRGLGGIMIPADSTALKKSNTISIRRVVPDITCNRIQAHLTRQWHSTNTKSFQPKKKSTSRSAQNESRLRHVPPRISSVTEGSSLIGSLLST